MFEKIFGKKHSIQRGLVIGFILAIIIIEFFTSIGFQIFNNKEVFAKIGEERKESLWLYESTNIIRATKFTTFERCFRAPSDSTVQDRCVIKRRTASTSRTHTTSFIATSEFSVRRFSAEGSSARE